MREERTVPTTDPGTTAAERALARDLWRALEPYHGVVVFAPQVHATFADLGITSPWGTYFGGRIAPLGEVSPAAVTAAFYHFRPAMVERETLAVWRAATPQQLLAARLDGVDAALRNILPDVVDSPELAEAAHLATSAAANLQPAGRVLGAANAALPVSDQPHLALWQAATTLREYRGDGHVSALVTAGLDGPEALVSIVAAGGETRESLQPRREWSDAEWTAATQRLTARGWLTTEGTLTPLGRARRQTVEDLTDELAVPAWRPLGEDAHRLYKIVQPWGARLRDALRPRRNT
jgi:hypothetical protein